MSLIHTKNRRRNCFYSSEKINSYKKYKDFTKSNPKVLAQYLYADPSFIKQAAMHHNNRLEGGAGTGCKQQEVFYDCWPCESEREPQLQIFEIINEIENPREFKSLLKQMASTSNALYQTFRKAYGKTKKYHKNSSEKYSKTCGNKLSKPCQHMECGDMNPLDNIINIELPVNSREYLEDYETLGGNKQKKKKSCRPYKCCGEQAQSCRVCINCQDYENICNICMGVLEPEEDTCGAKSSQKYKKPGQFDETIKKDEVSLSDEKKECNFSTWFPQTPTCLGETNACKQYEDELQHLNYCDRCAVLRGEVDLLAKRRDEPLNDQNQNVCEKSSQTCQKLKNSKPESASKSQKQLPSAKQVLNLNPVCVTIPLKLQLDSQNCQSRFIETEIVMEAFSGSQTWKLPQPLQKNCAHFSSTETPTNAKPPAPASTSNTLQQKTGSDLYYSCKSSSGIIKPDETPPTVGKIASSEVLNIIRKHQPNSQETSKPSTEIRLQTKSTQVTQPESSVATTMTDAKTFSSRTDFTQTEQLALPTVTKPDAKAEAKQLRAELLEEVRATLEQTTPKAALKALSEGKHFSLPADLRAKDISSTKPVAHSLPTNHPMPLTTLQLSALPVAATAGTPALPTKPKLPPKPATFVTETVQTDASTMNASGHYKRNEMRTKIQDELKELLQPNPSKSQAKYAPEERDDILLDLHKLFHPEKAGRLPKQLSREIALQDIRYLVGTEANKPGFPATDTSTPKTSESQESIIQSIKHILNPKSEQKSKKKKYSKDTKEKILEDLQIILTPRPKKPEANQEIRESVLHDLRYMLDTGQESTSPNRPPRLSQLQTAAAADTGPSSSRVQQVRQQRQQKPPNEIRDSLIADLRYLLDTTQPAQTNNSNNLEDNLVHTREDKTHPPQPPSLTPKPTKSSSTISSEASLSDTDKRNEKHKQFFKLSSSTGDPSIGGSNLKLAISANQNDSDRFNGNFNNRDGGQSPPTPTVGKFLLNTSANLLLITTASDTFNNLRVQPIKRNVRISMATTIKSSSSSDTFFLEMQDQSPRKSQQKKNK